MPETTTHLTSVTKIIMIGNNEYELSYTREIGSDPNTVVFIEEIDGPCFSLYCRSDCNAISEQMIVEMDICKNEFEEYATAPFEN